MEISEQHPRHFRSWSLLLSIGLTGLVGGQGVKSRKYTVTVTDTGHGSRITDHETRR